MTRLIRLSVLLALFHGQANTQGTLQKVAAVSLWAIFRDTGQADASHLITTCEYSSDGNLQSQADSPNCFAQPAFDFNEKANTGKPSSGIRTCHTASF